MRGDSADPWMLLRAQEIWPRFPCSALHDLIWSLFLWPICSHARRLYKLVAALRVCHRRSHAFFGYTEFEATSGGHMGSPIPCACSCLLVTKTDRDRSFS